MIMMIMMINYDDYDDYDEMIVTSHLFAKLP